MFSFKMSAAHIARYSFRVSQHLNTCLVKGTNVNKESQRRSRVSLRAFFFVSAVYFYFSLPGIVLNSWHPPVGVGPVHCPVALPATGQTIKGFGMAKIVHGWPKAFLTRNVVFVEQRDRLPEHTDSSPCWLVPALWNPFRGHNIFEFSLSALLVDICTLAVLLVVCGWLSRSIREFVKHRSWKLKNLLAGVAFTAICVDFAAGFYNDHSRQLSFNDQVRHAGGSLGGTKRHETLVRLVGHDNVPPQFCYQTNLNAKDVTQEDFTSLVSLASSTITIVTAPEGQPVNNRFINEITRKLSLSELALCSPQFPDVGVDLAPLNSIPKICFYNVTDKQRNWLNKHLTTKVEYIGRQ